MRVSSAAFFADVALQLLGFLYPVHLVHVGVQAALIGRAKLTVLAAQELGLAAGGDFVDLEIHLVPEPVLALVALEDVPSSVLTLRVAAQRRFAGEDHLAGGAGQRGHVHHAVMVAHQVRAGEVSIAFEALVLAAGFADRAPGLVLGQDAAALVRAFRAVQ